MISTDTNAMQKSVSQFEQPYCFLGSGRLVAILWKTPTSEFDARYRFSVGCGPTSGDESSLFFEPADIKYLVKLAQVTASFIADDGCMDEFQRNEIRQVAEELDQLTQQWDATDRLKVAQRNSQNRGSR